MSRDEIKSLLMRAAGGDLNNAEQERLQHLLDDDSHLDALAQLQREHTVLDRTLSKSDDAVVLGGDHRARVMAHAQQQAQAYKANRASATKRIPWVLVQQLAAACLVIAVLFGLFFTSVGAKMSSKALSEDAYAPLITTISDSADEPYTKPQQQAQRNGLSRHDKQSKYDELINAEDPDGKARWGRQAAPKEPSLSDLLNEVDILDQSVVVTDLDVPVEEVETESAVRESIEPKGREEAQSRSETHPDDFFVGGIVAPGPSKPKTIPPLNNSGKLASRTRLSDLEDDVNNLAFDPQKAKEIKLRDMQAQHSHYGHASKKIKSLEKDEHGGLVLNDSNRRINLESNEKPQDIIDQYQQRQQALKEKENKPAELNKNLLEAESVRLTEIQGHTEKTRRDFKTAYDEAEPESVERLEEEPNSLSEQVEEVAERMEQLSDLRQEHRLSDGPVDGGLVAGEDDADERLEELSKALERANNDNKAVAQYNYEQGLKAYAENRLDDAVKHLQIAAQTSPGDDAYRKKLREVGAAAGVVDDPRDVFADNIADTLAVEHQRLLIEIEQNIDAGEKLLADGQLAEAKKYFNMAKVRTQNLPVANKNRISKIDELGGLLARVDKKMLSERSTGSVEEQRQQELRSYNLRLEKNRIDAMLARAERARKERNYDEAILYAQNVLKINPSHKGAHDALVQNRRERHVYLRQITADLHDEEHLRLSEKIEEDMLPQLELVEYSDEWQEIDARRSAQEKVRKEAQKIVESYPSTVRVYLNEAISEARIGNYDQSAIYLNQALRENPDNKLIYNFYLAMGDRFILKLSENKVLKDPMQKILQRAKIYKKELRNSSSYQELLVSKLLKHEDERLVATRELIAIGPKAIPALLKKMNNANEENEQYIIETLAHLAKRFDEAKPALRQAREMKHQRQVRKALRGQEQRNEREMARRKQPVRNYPVNPWVQTKQDSLSTFAIDTDAASYRQARNYIMRGYLPPAGLVRMEEFVNAFDYNYLRQSYKTFTVHTEAGASPYSQELTLVKVGIKGKVIGREERKPAHLVIAIDTSGSMNRADRLPLIQDACLQLLDQLDKNDKITLVTYGRQARLLLEAISVHQKSKIANTIRALQCDSSTDLRQGLELAYKLASRYYRAGTVNRVILCSDGVANVGETDVTVLLDAVKQYKDQGITCTTVGVGNGVYNDELLERLANNGDGTYLYVDSREEARRLFSEELSATLQYIAKDVKIQVDFDPNVVRRYRLIGYENRAIADKDFRNDSVDAGEVGSGQSATALYEVELLKHNTDASDLGTIYLRWKDVDTAKVTEEAHRIKRAAIAVRSPKTDPRFYLAAIAAEFAEILRESEHAANRDVRKLLQDIHTVSEILPLDQNIQQLKQLIQKAHGLPRGQ